MRLSLKRPADAAPHKPLRERAADLKARFAETGKRAGQALRVAKVVMRPEPAKPTPVERIALINYATWLYHERLTVCGEIHPETGADAHRFVHMDVASRRFHFPTRSEGSPPPPASARAVETLDRLGIDWRADRANSVWGEEPGRVEQDPAPLPHGWPRADAAVLEALDDLTRIDRAIDALGGGDRDTDEVPGYAVLDDARGEALSRLEQSRPKTLLGLQAKARVVLRDSLKGDAPTIEDIAKSLARDLLGARQPAIEPRPDPVIAAIAENARLEAVADAFERTIPHDQDVPADACHAVMVHFHDVLLKTVPTTARGCQALARFVPAFFERWGIGLEDDAPAAFALIARSPLL